MKHLLPETWAAGERTVAVGGVSLGRLAEGHGTPLLVLDEQHVTKRLADFRSAFGHETRLIYAGKAFLCGALVRMLNDADWWIDVVSGGELELARRAGFPMDRLVLHGNAKSPAELNTAVAAGVGRIVVDHPGEVDALLDAVARNPGAPDVSVLLRLNVPLDPDTHDKVKTVGPTAHFGMDLASAEKVVRRIAGRAELGLSGIHIHAGSQIGDLDLFRRVGDAAVRFVEPLRGHFPTEVELDLGGGLAVPYAAGDEVPTPEDYARAVRAGLEDADAGSRLGGHRLMVEPGRSVIANAGVTLYRVQSRKRLPELGEVLAADGGLSDNPRPSLYGAHYEVVNVTRAGTPDDGSFRVVGRHCESGDVIAPAVSLPATSDVGDVLAIPATGAYVYSMSSRYNGVGRPAVVLVGDGTAREVVRRESNEDLLACDLDLLDRPLTDLDARRP